MELLLHICDVLISKGFAGFQIIEILPTGVDETWDILRKEHMLTFVFGDKKFPGTIFK